MLKDGFLSFPLCFGRPEIISVCCGTDTIWYDIGRNIVLHYMVHKSKRLFIYGGLFILRIPVSSKTEISQTVTNHFSLVYFQALQYMGMRADQKVCSPVNHIMGQFSLIIIRIVVAFDAPMAAGNHKICTLIPQFSYAITNISGMFFVC